MKLENSIFEETYRTSFSQTGIHETLTNKSFLSMMENLAGAHSGYCHYSFADLAPEHKTWIILNWKLQVFRRPYADEIVTLKTWGHFANKIYVLRDFKMLDKDGNLLAIASSKWCLFDFSTGRIAKLPDNLEEIYQGFNSESVFNCNDLPKLKAPESEPIASDTYKIRRFDLDLNKHVHNLNYLNIAYELLPLDVYDGPELNNVEIVYKKEIKYGDTIKSYLYKENDAYIIVIKSLDGSIVHSIVKLY